MAIQVLGTYPTEQEAITAVNVHSLAGLRADNITLFANQHHADSLKEKVHVTIKSDEPEDKNTEAAGLMDKVKHVFSGNNDYELHSKALLVDYGLTESEAAQCLDDVEAGKIVVLADDELRMGHNEDILSH